MSSTPHSALATEWKYYQNAIIPTAPPHQPPALTDADAKALFRRYPKALFIRWHSDYDCGEETKWWYCIKDTAYDIESLRSKDRYKITKARRYFEFRKVSAKEFQLDICDVWIQSMRGYKERDRHDVTPTQLLPHICAWDDESHLDVFAVFFRETGQMCGFTLIAKQGKAIHSSSHKTIPEFEKYGVNAALMDGVLTEYNPLLEQGYYICDGTRNIMHQTNFQEYWEKLFGFRKAYCRLHVRYRAGIGILVKLLSLFRCLFKKLDSIALIHKINGILLLDQYKEKVADM